MYKRKDLLLMKPEELAKVLMDYSKDKKGEIADLTNVASIQIKVLNDRNNEKTDKLFAIDRELDEVKSWVCDEICKMPNEVADDEELMGICEKCRLAKMEIK